MVTTLPPQSVVTTDELAPGPVPRRAPRVPAEERAESLELSLGRLAIQALRFRRLDQAAKLAATGLAELLGGGRLAVGLVRPGGTACRLCGLSSVPQIDHRSERSQAFEAALAEVVLCNTSTAYGASVVASSTPLPLKAHERVARATGSRAVVGLPVSNGSQTTSVLLWCDEGRSLDAASAQAVLTRASEFLGPALETVARAERTAVARLADRIRELTAHRRRAILVGAAAVACLLLLPLPYRPSYSARLEPTARRYVVAPFESMLEKTLVRPGDVVKRQETVATLDGRELRVELATKESELQQAYSRYDAALAAHKPAETELARLEIEKLSLECKRLADRRGKLQIKSPVRGVVLSGELERAEGAALTTGQTLLEIAPLDELFVEIAVPDDQLRFIEAGREVSVKLEAFPGQKWQGAVQRVRPLAEIRDAQNVFIAEVRLENREGSLRPGMKGRARIAGPIRPLAWIAFHRPYEAVRQWLGW